VPKVNAISYVSCVVNTGNKTPERAVTHTGHTGHTGNRAMYRRSRAKSATWANGTFQGKAATLAFA